MSDIEIPEKGDYPFRNVSPTKQNGYVAWIRDHSSYLTAGGIADQLASVGSYATGMLKNFLCLSPLFLLASLVFGWFHFANLERPYFLAGSVALLVFGVACWVDRDKCRPSFYLSSLANRARIGRCGGWSILGVLVGLTTLLVPLSVELLREHLHGIDWTWTKFTSLLFGGFGALVAAQRAVPLSNGRRKKVAVFLFGAIGIVFMFATVIGLTYFFVYGNLLGPMIAGNYPLSRTPESTIAIVTLGLLLLFAVVRLRRRWRGLGWSDGIIALVVCISPFIPIWMFGADTGYGYRLNEVAISIGKLSRPLALVVDKPFDEGQLTPSHAKRIKRLQSQLDGLNDYFETQPPEQKRVDIRNGYVPKVIPLKADEKASRSTTEESGVATNVVTVHGRWPRAS